MKTLIIKILMLVCLLPMLVACGGKSHEDTDTAAADSSTFQAAADNYMAEHDIAMTVSSLADAVSVGEELKAEDYDYTGILTDGRGTPIYTDSHGAPGEWDVKITDKDNAVISSKKGGDIIPEFLVQYIIDNTRIAAANRMLIDELEYSREDGETILDRYAFEGGQINFSTVVAQDDEGNEFSSLTIRVSRNNTDE